MKKLIFYFLFFCFFKLYSSLAWGYEVNFKSKITCDLFANSTNNRNERNMNVTKVVLTKFEFELPETFQKQIRFYVSNSSTKLDYTDVWNCSTFRDWKICNSQARNFLVDRKFWGTWISNPAHNSLDVVQFEQFSLTKFKNMIIFIILLL